MREQELISIVVPTFNEEDVCDQFVDRIVPVMESLGHPYEVIFIDDGSSDATLEKLKVHVRAKEHLKILCLSRNFGQEYAMAAGLDAAAGAAVISIDCDLQNPPELITNMVQHWKQGAQMVTGIRKKRDSDPWHRRALTGAFYGVMQRVTDIPVPPQVGNFRLMDRQVVDALKSLPERIRYMRGLYAWVGYRTVYLPYTHPDRVGGDTKYGITDLWNLALDGLFSFSTLPLKIWTYLGVFVATSSFLYGLYILIRALFWGFAVPGYASLFVAVVFLSGMILTGMGVLGEYIGRIFQEVKERPLYIVSEKIGFDQAEHQPQEALHEQPVPKYPG